VLIRLPSGVANAAARQEPKGANRRRRISRERALLNRPAIGCIDHDAIRSVQQVATGSRAVTVLGNALRKCQSKTAVGRGRKCVDVETGRVIGDAVHNR